MTASQVLTWEALQARFKPALGVVDNPLRATVFEHVALGRMTTRKAVRAGSIPRASSTCRSLFRSSGPAISTMSRSLQTTVTHARTCRAGCSVLRDDLVPSGLPAYGWGGVAAWTKNFDGNCWPGVMRIRRSAILFWPSCRFRGWVLDHLPGRAERCRAQSFPAGRRDLRNPLRRRSARGFGSEARTGDLDRGPWRQESWVACRMPLRGSRRRRYFPCSTRRASGSA